MRDIVTASMLAEQERHLRQLNKVKEIHADVMATRNQPRRAA